MEKHIEKTKEVYYRALWDSDQRWYEGENDPTPFIKYMLGVILACYREFESRVNIISGTTVISETETGKKKVITIKSKAFDIVKASVDTKIGKFTKREIVNICPSISEKSVEASLKKLLDEEYIVKHGSGKGTFYSKKI